MSTYTEKAQLLIGQNRFELALKELAQELMGTPDDPHVHALMAVCLRQLNRLKEALDSARRAVQVGPDYAFGHYVLAGVYIEDDRLKEAEQAAREAIRLEPEDADYYTRLASIHIQKRQWEEGLQAAERALELEPTNSGGLNLRSMALNQLNRVDEAAAATQGALAANPDDAMAHASRGWQEVRAGRLDAAMSHFRDALRLDSSLEWAREGVVETIKARNPVYRGMLSYFLWTSRLQPKVLWGLILGGYVLSRVLRDFGKANPQWEPYTWLVLGPYIAFVLMTWIADPLFNLLLRTHPVGRVALSRSQLQAANWFGGSLLLAVVSLAAWAATAVEGLLVLGIVSALMSIPISSSLPATGRARRILLTYTWILGALGLCVVVVSSTTETEIAAISIGGFALGIMMYFWVANWVKQRY